MLTHTLDAGTGILTLTPSGPLSVDDFVAVSNQVDTYLSTHGTLTGILLDVPEFPGWKDFAAMLEHLRFIRGHHQQIERIAVLTDNALLKLPPSIAEHFAHPQFRVFGAGAHATATRWLQDPASVPADKQGFWQALCGGSTCPVSKGPCGNSLLPVLGLVAAGALAWCVFKGCSRCGSKKSCCKC